MTATPFYPNFHRRGKRQMSADRQTLVEPLLLNAVEAARLLGVSRSKLYTMHSAGLLPLPVALGGCVRWDRDELRAWLSARNPKTGLLPTRQQWIEILENQK
jgi:excisionase family DNA binding protein